VVLDTNVVVSALLLSQGRRTWIRAAWRDGSFLPLASHGTLDELVRVLAYPKFGLSRDEIMTLLGDYVPYVEVVAVPADAGADLPPAPGPDDQKFLDLAVAGAATHLVTGDARLLEVARAGGFVLLSPDAFRAVVTR
jgi:putative PIN family toxin of toxin-antitoxin system